jgi:hypothetical protein
MKITMGRGIEPHTLLHQVNAIHFILLENQIGFYFLYYIFFFVLCLCPDFVFIRVKKGLLPHSIVKPFV